jgi:predicted O-methyltransferase YrrM
MNIFKFVARFVQDEFVKIKHVNLSRAFKIKSHLTIPERACLYNLSKNAIYIAEIGSYLGASACCFGTAANDFGTKKIFCIDTWNNDAMTEGNRDTWTEFQINTSAFNEYIIPLRGFSMDVVEEVRIITARLDLLFIDGDHSFEGVKTDWEFYKCFMKPGSIVVFHDYGWAEGVKRVVHDHVMPLVDDYDSLPNMWWGKLAMHP